MAVETVSFLKNNNTDFNNVLDSFYNIQDGLAPVALTTAATVTLNKADHAGRLLLVPSTATANDSYIYQREQQQVKLII